MWTSKLGNKYSQAWMQENDKASQAELKRIRRLSGNGVCADCGRLDSSWASVTHGVFICMICSDVHRSVGTHITKVKGCTGTYLWGPDELEQMRAMGNEGANVKFGSEKISPDASKEQKQRYVVDKYDKLAFAGKSGTALVRKACSASKDPAANTSATTGNISVRPAAAVVAVPVKGATPPRVVSTSKAAEVQDSWFDDFFNDDAFADNASLGAQAPVVGADLQPMQVALKALPEAHNSLDLDAFLNSTLQAEADSAPVAITAYPTKLSFPPSAPLDVEADPFADWPDF